jgi:hypothetical protein
MTLSPAPNMPDRRTRRLALIIPSAALLMLAQLVIAQLLFLWPVRADADHPLTIIELRHQIPEALIPQLAPLAGPDGVVTGARDVLLVRASPARLADIRRALEVLDRPARNLLVEVRLSTSARERERGVGVSIDQPIGRDRRVVVGSPAHPNSADVRLRDRRYEREDEILQRVRVLDGASARIGVGQTTSVPVRERWSGPGGGGYTRQSLVGVDSGTGFTVTPRVTGDRVVVDLDQGSMRPARGGFVGGSLQTQVTGPLGAWIPLGGNEQDSAGRLRGLATSAEADAQGLSGLELRVTPLD